MKNKLVKAYIVLSFILGLNGIVSAGEKELSDIIEKQQARLDEMQAEIDGLRSYVQDDDDDFFGNVQIHGFVSQGYLHSKNNNQLTDSKGDGSFQFNEIGINFTSQLSDNLRMGIQFLSRDIGVVDQNKVKIDWAYMDYRIEDWLGLRVGKVKTPVGLLSETRDVDMLRTPVLLPLTLVYGESFRELMNTIQGAGVYGMIDIGDLGSLSYTAQMGVTSHDADDGGVKYEVEGLQTMTAVGGEIRDFNSQEAFATRVNWETPIEGLLLGGSYSKFAADATVYIPAYSATTTMSFRNFITTVASAQYTIDELVLTSEFQRVVFDIEPEGSTKELHMWFALADYRFNDLYSMALGYTEYFNAQDRDGSQAAAAGYNNYSQWTKDWYLSSKFDLTENWVFKAELHFLDGDRHNYQSLNAGGSDRHDVLLALKTTVSF